MATTANLGIIKLTASQAQKEVTANAAFDALDKSMAGLLSKSVAGGSTVNLTASEASNAVIVLTGLLTGNIDVTFPVASCRKSWVVYNATTGAFSLTVKVTGQTGAAITQGQAKVAFNTGTDIALVA